MAIINFNSISGVSTISVASSITVGSGVTITATSITAPTFVGNVSATTGITTVTQLNVGTGGTVITTTAAGLVGIGTTNPQQLLTLNQSTASHRILAINRENSATPALYLGNDSSQNAVIAANNSDIRLGYDFQTTFNETVRITSSGNVGIGTINPTEILHVLKSGSTDTYMRFQNSGGNVYLGSSSAGDAIISADTNGKSLKVFTSGSQKFQVSSSGDISTPNNLGAGLDIGYKKVVTLSGTYSANTWYNTGIDRTTDTGIYLLNAWVDTYAAGGESYQETYIGWFVLPNRNANNAAADTIYVHRAGHAPNNETLQFRTLRQFNLSGGNILLQWLSNYAYTTSLNGSSGRSIQIAIHRFGTALNNG